MENEKIPVRTQKATFGAGCFWCVEAIFLRVKGVISVKSGYSGGLLKNPTYKEVCMGRTGHAEVCEITFDPEQITYIELLEIFWQIHDPTTLNRQGNDVGTQYRSVIFYHNEEQKHLSEQMKLRLDREGIWEDPVITEIVPYEIFYGAEDYHDNYFAGHPEQSYCALVITPKIEKFKKTFSEYLQ
jgi:peptide-methionine (S)-S-oxide reductase